MTDIIADIVTVKHLGQNLTLEEEVALEKSLNCILEKIRRQKHIKTADLYLTQLGHFQSELARACFKWGIPLPQKLRQLVREFDRSDDYETKLAVFNNIKKGTFLL